MKTLASTSASIFPNPVAAPRQSAAFFQAIDSGALTRRCHRLLRIQAVLCGIAAPLVVAASHSVLAASGNVDLSPRAEERQLPKQMHSAMKELPHVTVGQAGTDLIGTDHRALQAAVDYVAGLGGGIVDIGPGEYLMRDSLHLRSYVTVRGTPRKTILRKSDGVVSALGLDGDFGEEQITLVDPQGFDVGCGVAIWDANASGFHLTVARIIGRNGNTVAINRPLMADCMVANKAKAATIFPVISGYDLEGARLEHLIIEGNKEHNAPLDGCRGGGIFLYRGFGTVIAHCIVRNYNGDGISFQQSNDVTVEDCLSENNAALGLHPGSGSQRPTVRHCVARNNGTDGLFLCWRVRHGLFQDNTLEGNGRHGISIGHKDTDNVLQSNLVRWNHADGIHFREESLGMAGHRNQVTDNLIENNGVGREAAGIRLRGEIQDVVLKNNRIRDTRPEEARQQTIGIQLDEKVGPVTLDGNAIEARVTIKDQRPRKLAPASGPMFTWNREAGLVALKRPDGPAVWQFNFAPTQPKPYFHPVALPGSPPLTWLNPPDHPWHYGLWFTWKYLNGKVYWEFDPKTGKEEGLIEWTNVIVSTHPDFSAGIEMDLLYHPAGESQPVLRERRRVDVSAPSADGSYHFDWTMTFTAAGPAVKFERTPIAGQPEGVSWGGYAGLTFRFAKEFQKWSVLNADGMQDLAAHGQKSNGCDFRGQLAGQPVGVAMIDHPQNLNAPTPWYVAMDTKTLFGCLIAAPIFHQGFTLEAGKDFTLRYRVVLHPDTWNVERLRKEYSDYSGSPQP